MPVSDLTPLQGLRLKELCVRGTRATDLTPIKEMPLRSLRLDYRADQKEVLRSLSGLEVINDKPVADFWKEVARQ
jgi:eukaryotic-like serine/threonine-protein kinase